MKDWNSPVYAFFNPTPEIIEIDGCRAHNFKCQARNCKTKKHVRSCWGDEVLKAADEAKDAKEVCQRIVGSFLQNGLITASFKCKGKGKVTYSHCQHTCAETSLHPFDIVKDCAFQSLLKTGRPDYYIPSPSTVLCDRVTTMLQEYNSKINFTTDSWSSPNHHALVTFSAHFEHKGEPLSIPLDVVEVGKVKKTHLCRYV
ncbi:uncharacterized protein F5147DRAFT_743971 [Suillus discolor]|uniref:Uncharacterized protein n=1 Tax=Suillus discolor TaxID=1912936 RepID=A0A9P7FF40_9AGAM|nr:uncharacterized protein F5147DRAFT_743971 [Suillus discolor]KAG2114231.1 hypothetical protein F5147DRAFT_743971 [Suillus discolor]